MGNKRKVKYRYCPYCKKETVTQKDNAGIDYVVLGCTCGHAWIESGKNNGYIAWLYHKIRENKDK